MNQEADVAKKGSELPPVLFRGLFENGKESLCRLGCRQRFELGELPGFVHDKAIRERTADVNAYPVHGRNTSQLLSLGNGGYTSSWFTIIEIGLSNN